MHAQTLIITLILVSLVIFLTILAQAIYRKEQPLYLYSISFGCSVLGITMVLFQATLPSLLGIIIPSLLLALAFAFLTAGIRRFFRLPGVWTWRYSLYLGLYLIHILIFTYLEPNYQIRIVGYHALVLILALDCLLSIREKLNAVPSTIRRTVKAVYLAYAVYQLFRILLSLDDGNVGRSLLQNNAYSSTVFLGAILFQIAWCSIILLLDSNQLIQELKKRNLLLESIARTDKLTGLLNRNSFDLEVTEIVELADRHDLSLSFIVLDLDHFKRVNDEFGHPAGDKVLMDLARLIQESIRGTDKAFRWGGEEFLILLPNTDLAGATALAEKLRTLVEQYEFEKVGHMTVSLGVAERFQWESREQWFKRTDLCLYRAKAGGRNQVVSWQESDQLPLSLVKAVWRREWESGNTDIDSDHQILVDWINQLLDMAAAAREGGQSKEAASALLEQMLQHCRGHFDREEKILDQIQYPEYLEHQKLHQELLEEAQILQKKYLDDDIQPEEFYSFLLGKVVVGHIMTADAKFFPYLK